MENYPTENDFPPFVNELIQRNNALLAVVAKQLVAINHLETRTTAAETISRCLFVEKLKLQETCSLLASRLQRIEGTFLFYYMP